MAVKKIKRRSMGSKNEGKGWYMRLGAKSVRLVASCERQLSSTPSAQQGCLLGRSDDTLSAFDGPAAGSKTRGFHAPVMRANKCRGTY